MSFVINTNIKAMNASANTSFINRELSSSLEKLSSGLRINKAADDSSGMAIADSLRSQSNALGQAIRNTNDAIGMVQIADKAMDEQLKILDTIKTKATQAGQDSQNRQSREAIQADVIRLIEQLDNIAFQTSYNGIKMLAGSFTNKEYQVGAYSNETIKVSIGATTSAKIGNVRKETTSTITASGVTSLSFHNPSGGSNIILESVVISTSAGTGLGVLAETINKNSDALGVRAVATVQSTGTQAVSAGNITNLIINHVDIGSIDNIKDNDSSGVMVNAINRFSMETGVLASIDESGRLNLTSTDGSGIRISSGAGAANVMKLGTLSAGPTENYGKLTLTSNQSNDIRFQVVNSGDILENVINSGGSQTTLNLRQVKGRFTSAEANAAGAFANSVLSGEANEIYGAGVTTKAGAMMVMDIAESAIKLLDRVRADIGSVQKQLEVTNNNITVTQVNVKAAESGIRDVDFGVESANFSKQNILIQSGSYALSQANASQQHVMRLLQ